MTEESVFEESSGNVFADLGLEDAEKLFTRGNIGIVVFHLLWLQPYRLGRKLEEFR